jgi:AcrR family transcriptional regulator
MRQAERTTRPASATAPRGRILHAAFRAFTRHGFAQTSTLAIASAANVSKREIYSLFGSKEALLGACIAARAERMRRPIQLAEVRDRTDLSRTLTACGATLLREATDPAVTAVFRLAIAEAIRSPKIARLLERTGRAGNRAALAALLAQAQALGLIASSDAHELAARFLALLWGDLQLRLLLGVGAPPTRPEAERRARRATDEFLRLYAAA